MLICVYGEDNFRVVQKVKQLREHFVQKFDNNGMNTSLFSTTDKPGLVISSMKSGSLLSSKRFVVVDGLIENTKSDSVDTWVDTLCKTDSDAIVVLKESISKAKFEKQPLGKAIKDAEERHDYDFPSLSGSGLSSWVSHEAASLGGSFQYSAAQKLVALVGSDTWQLHQEIRKLIGLAGGDAVSEEMVLKMVDSNYEDKIFDFIDAVSKKQTTLAIKLLQQQRMGGIDDGHLLSMLIRQIRVLLGTRDLLDRNAQISKEDAASQLSVHPYVAQKALQQTQRYVMCDLIYLHELLFGLEKQIKIGQIRPRGALERLLSEVLKK